MEWFLSTYKLASSLKNPSLDLSSPSAAKPFLCLSSQKKKNLRSVTYTLPSINSSSPLSLLFIFMMSLVLNNKKLWVNRKIKWGFMNSNNKNPTSRVGSRLCFVAILLALPSSLMLALSWGWYQHGCHRTRCLSRNDNSQWKKRNCLLVLLFEKKRTLWKSSNRRPLTSLCPELYHVPIPNWIIARGKQIIVVGLG